MNALSAGVPSRIRLPVHFPDDRECLRWIADWEVSDIAKALSIQPSTVRVHLKHARDALRRELSADIPFLRELGSGEEPDGKETAS